MALETLKSRTNEIRNEWLQAILSGKPSFSFIYDNIPSSECIGSWQVKSESNPQANGTIVHKIVYKDEASGMECIQELVEYPEHPVLEWVIRFRNTSASNSSVLSAIKALDIAWPCKSEDSGFLHYSKGTTAKIDDFILQKKEVLREASIELTSNSSSSILPFFNLETGNTGLISAIGWTGKWALSVERKLDEFISIQGGMAQTNLILYPNETIRSPRVLLLFWKEDIQNGHNMLRQHIILHHMPRPEGNEVEAPICNATWGGMKTHNHLKNIQYIKDNQLDYDCYWIDAGWFGPDHKTDEYQNLNTEDWAYNMGHFRVNRMVHPDGLRPIADAAHAAGMKLMLWFSTFVAVEDAPWVQEHPEWRAGGPVWGTNGIGANPKPVNVYKINFSHSEARKWIMDKISSLLAEHGVDYYREDMGSPGTSPDEPNRIGIGEIRAVEGLYDFWDELLAKHPSMLIDNCCAGGTRIDLETIGRSLVLHRTDYNCHPDADPIGAQVGTYGLSHWVPLVGGAPPADPGNTYNFRSSWSGGMWFNLYRFIGYDEGETGPDENYPVAWHREMISQYRRARKYYKGDFYPLTDCTLSTRDWLVYQFDRLDLGEGMVLAFRRKDSPFETAVFQLHRLDSESQYDLENVDTGLLSQISGKDLLETGVSITLYGKPGSQLIFYRKSSH